MITQGSILKVVDSYGARTAKCICVYQKIKGLGRSGDLILVSIRRCRPHKKLKKGELYKGIITQMAQFYYRNSGVYIKGTGNYMVLLDKRYRAKGHTSWKDPKEPYAKRIFGSVDTELRYTGYFKVLSMSSKVF